MEIPLMRIYSEELKKTMVQKLCAPGGPSVSQLSKESGIPPANLYNWVYALGRSVKMSKDRRTDDWSPEEKLQAVFEAQGLSGEQLGEFLRRRGLHSRQIDEWKKESIAGIAGTTKPRGRPRKDPELVAALEENKLLKRDLRRKEKALAEQTALVILQKKVQALWGDEEDE